MIINQLAIVASTQSDHTYSVQVPRNVANNLINAAERTLDIPDSLYFPF